MGVPSEMGSVFPFSDTMKGVRSVGRPAVRYHIIYLSPNGSTRSVAEALARGLVGGDASVTLIDLADTHADLAPESMANPESIFGVLEPNRGDHRTCLFIGSPVYFNRAVPPVLAFIEELPRVEGGWAVPFVTFGKACSGVALWQMADALRNRGYRIAGAAKVQAVHSLMWESQDPVGGGHPNQEELDEVRRFAETLDHRLEADTIPALDLPALDYHPTELTAELRSLIGKPWPIMPKSVDGEVCTECGTCADVCPVRTISLNPLPEFGAECIDCFNCVRLCPEGAIDPETPLAVIGEMVRNRVRAVNETPPTQMILPRLP